MVVGYYWRHWKLDKTAFSMKEFWEDQRKGYTHAPKTFKEYIEYAQEYAVDLAKNYLIEMVMYYGEDPDQTRQWILEAADHSYNPHFKWKGLDIETISEIWYDGIVQHAQEIVDKGRESGQMFHEGKPVFEDDDNVIITEICHFMDFLAEPFIKTYRTHSQFSRYIDFWEREVKFMKTRDPKYDEEMVDFVIWKPEKYGYHQIVRHY